MKKVLRIFALCLLLVMTFTVIASAEEVQPRSSGYEVYNIRHNGKNYTAYISDAYTAANGATVQISSEASIWVKMNDLKAQFNTHNHGYVTEKGGGVNHFVRLHDPAANPKDRVSGTSTRSVHCRYGSDQVIGSPSILGSGDIICLKDSGVKDAPRTLRV